MVSLIIVHYAASKELFTCLSSIYASKPKTSFEIIVVDNDERKKIYPELKKKFPKVKYVKNDNKGFGQGNNIGAQHAKGEYLFFLNPDTQVEKGTIDTSVTYLSKNKKVGIVAPMLYEPNGNIVPLQGARELTPLRAIFSFSFISKLFPKNPIAKRYWYLSEWNKKTVKEVDSIPGTAFVIRREIYQQIHGFDERFFLYFEEHDLCNRVKELEWKIMIHPKTKIIHTLGSSTKQSKRDVSKVFRQSRFYYFKKHFGLLQALLAESVLRINKMGILLVILVLLGLYLRSVNIEQSMSFIGDQGWYYLSARDMLLTGQIPLVGIASSHPWIHQGALWTYLLAGGLWFFSYNPFAGVYLSSAFGLAGTVGMYLLGKSMFSNKVGLIAAALFATSPLIVLSDRMPYHTSPIPLVTIFLLYYLYQWIRGNSRSFPLVIITLAVLYNLELATFLLTLFVGGLWLYGFITKKTWAKNIFQRKILLVAGGLWLVVMLPMLLHDIQNGFPQTLKFIAWVGYRGMVFFGYPQINPITHVPFGEMIKFVASSYQQLIFAANGWVALVICLASFIYFLRNVLDSRFHGNDSKNGFVLLFFLNIFLVVGLLLAKTPSEAYLPMLFPGLLLMSAVFFSKLRVIGVLGVLGVILINSYLVIGLTSSNVTFLERLKVATNIVQQAQGKEYNLIGRGAASEFASFTMGYEYLTWWLGHGPSKEPKKLQFFILEENGRIEISKEER